MKLLFWLQMPWLGVILTTVILCLEISMLLIFASIYASKNHFDLSFVYAATRIWNDLPDDVCSVKSLSSFRISVQKFTHPSFSLHSGSLCKSLHTLVFSGLLSVFLCDPDPCNVSDLMNMISNFWHYAP